MIEIHTIETMNDYISFVESLPPEFELSRGQERDYPLLPSACRLGEDGKRLYSNKTTAGFLEEFYSNSSIYLTESGIVLTSPSDSYETMIWAQHYGVPTRLLDFTYSHLISLMFAVENSLISDSPNDAVIWFLAPQMLNEISIKQMNIINISDPSLKTNFFANNDLPSVVSCTKTNKRINAQNGVFVLFNMEHGALETQKQADKYLKKVVIPADKTKDMLVSLFKMGMRFSHLYPEIQSISKDILLKHRVKEYLNDGN